MSLFYFIQNYSHPSTGLNLVQSTTNLDTETKVPSSFRGLRFLLQPLANDAPALVGSRGSYIGWDGGSGAGVEVCVNNNCKGPFTYNALISGASQGGVTAYMTTNETQIRGHASPTVSNALVSNQWYLRDTWGMRTMESYAEMINMTACKPELQKVHTQWGGFHGPCWDPLQSDGGIGCNRGQNSQGYTSGSTNGISGCFPEHGNVPAMGQYQHYIMVDYSDDTEVHDPAEWKFFLQNIYGDNTHSNQQGLRSIVNAARTNAGLATLSTGFFQNYANWNAKWGGMLDYYIEIVPLYNYSSTNTATPTLNSALDNFSFRREDNGMTEKIYPSATDRFDHYTTDNAVSEIDELVRMLWKRIETADVRFTQLNFSEKRRRVWISKEPIPQNAEHVINGLGGTEWRRTIPYHYIENHFNGTWALNDYGLDLWTDNWKNINWGGYWGAYFGHVDQQNSPRRAFLNPQWNLIVTNGTQTHKFGNALPDTSNIFSPGQSATDPPMSYGEGAIQMNGSFSNYYHGPTFGQAINDTTII